MTQKNKYLLTLCMGCFTAGLAMAQQFNYTAALDAVTKTGFYQVSITPQLSSYVKPDFSDLRIVDEKGNWVPHIIRTVLPRFSQSMLREFPILSNQLNDSGKTVLVVENRGMGLRTGNKELLSISEIVLYIKNNAVSRYAALSGSNDQKNWYIINENILLSRNYESDSSYFISSVKFNTADYKYFKLVIDNERSDPLHIFKAGTYFNITFQATMPAAANPAPVIAQKDSSGKSYIRVQQAAAYHADEIQLDITGARFFKRNAALYLPQDNHSTVMRAAPEFSFVIESGTPNNFSIKTMQAAMFWIVIENNDNPPLQIKSINTRQASTTAVSWLEAGKKYSLLAGNAGAAPPDYDIASFKDSIPAAPPFITAAAFTKNEAATALPPKNNSNKWWLWPAIIGAIGILGFLSWKLLADMKKNEA